MSQLKKGIASFDLDGVIFLGYGFPGIYPGRDDIIITGRCFEEMLETKGFLESRFIYNQVFYQPIPFVEKTRVKSGFFKANKINELIAEGYQIVVHLDDDPIQADIIENNTKIPVIRIFHNLTEKENVRHFVE